MNPQIYGLIGRTNIGGVRTPTTQANNGTSYSFPKKLPAKITVKFPTNTRK